jgi:phenylacetate-CoA ligase
VADSESNERSAGLMMFHRGFMDGLRSLTAEYVFYPLAERLEQRDVRSKCKALADEMTIDFAERRRRSWAALVRTVQFAGAHVPYYRDLFARIRFDPENLTGDARYLQDLPYLTKDVIRSEGERLLRSDYAKFYKHVSKTGGSTGPAATIIYDQEAADWSSAVTRYARSTIGKTKFQSELHFASRFPDAFPLLDRVREGLKCLAMNRHNIFFSSFDRDELQTIKHKIESIRPYLVHSHPSTIVQIAMLTETPPSGGQAFAIFESSGELLTPRQREVISQRLGCIVIDRYGLAEVGIVAYQIDHQDSALRVFDPFCWPEIAPLENSDELGWREDANGGELVVTALKNRMMPLIRYRTGDLASLESSDDGFVIRHLDGRVHNVVEIAGRKVPTHYVQDILNRIPGIVEFQIKVGNSRPELCIVPENDADLEAICKRLIAWWGNAIDIKFIKSSELTLVGWRSKLRHVVVVPAHPVRAAADPHNVS